MTKIEKIKCLLETGREIDMQELNAVSFRYGGVLHKLRHDLGWVIETIAVDRKSGHFKYRLADRPLVYIESQGRTDAVMPVSLSLGGQI